MFKTENNSITNQQNLVFKNKIKIPAITLKKEHSVGRSGMTICMGIQNGGFAVELQHKNDIT